MKNNLKRIEIIGSDNRKMGVDVYINFAQESSKPVVIFCHGYKGFKDWGCWDLVAKEFADNGFNFVKFNFSHNGVSINNPTEFVDLEAFGNNNYTKELFDLQCVIDWISASTQFESYFDESKIYLIGHSRGGGIVTLTATKDFRIKKVNTWASVSNLIDRIPQNEEEWKEKGVVFQLNGRTKQNMPLYYQLKENTVLNMESLDIEKLARKIKIPFCIIHGKQDEAVNEKEAENLDRWISTSQLILIENAGHTFGAYHPYDKQELPLDLKIVVDESIKFFRAKKNPNEQFHSDLELN